MKKQKMSKNGALELLIGIVLGTFLTSIGYVAFEVEKATVDRTTRECAQRAVMTHYQPVGNGGALAEMYGDLTQERQEMYKRMHRAYEDLAGKDN